MLRRWIFHGNDDSVVYHRQSEKFVHLVKSKLPETNLKFDIAPGEDHAFDVEASKWEPFAERTKAIEWLKKAWLD